MTKYTKVIGNLPRTGRFRTYTGPTRLISPDEPLSISLFHTLFTSPPPHLPITCFASPSVAACRSALNQLCFAYFLRLLTLLLFSLRPPPPSPPPPLLHPSQGIRHRFAAAEEATVVILGLHFKKKKEKTSKERHSAVLATQPACLVLEEKWVGKEVGGLRQKEVRRDGGREGGRKRAHTPASSLFSPA